MPNGTLKHEGHLGGTLPLQPASVLAPQHGPGGPGRAAAHAARPGADDNAAEPDHSPEQQPVCAAVRVCSHITFCICQHHT
jgi:hypothetical protein